MDPVASSSTSKSNLREPPKACLECRRLGIKCDKVVRDTDISYLKVSEYTIVKIPCSQCQRRGATSLCSYDGRIPSKHRAFYYNDVESLKDFQVYSQALGQGYDKSDNLWAREFGQYGLLLTPLRLL